jgi:ribose transport system substrate-binding protein
MFHEGLAGILASYVFAANEPGVLGAVEALRRPGYDGEMVVVGWDGSPADVDAVREGVVNALVVQNLFQMGYQGVDTVIRKIREERGGREPGYRRHARDRRERR